MKKTAEMTFLRYASLLALIFSLLPGAQAGVYQHGTVVKMRMGDCLGTRHGFMMTFAGSNAPLPADTCPEYTLVSDKVVFVIVGRSSGQLVPLADVLDFRFQNNQLVVRIDDARRETRFEIKEMVLRSEWDLVQKHITEQLLNPGMADRTAVIRGGD